MLEVATFLLVGNKANNQLNCYTYGHALFIYTCHTTDNSVSPFHPANSKVSWRQTFIYKLLGHLGFDCSVIFFLKAKDEI